MPLHTLSYGAMIRILTSEDVKKALPMADAIEAMRDAFTALAAGRAQLPLRTALESPDGRSVSLIMPAQVEELGALGAKIVSVFPDNAKRGLPLIHGVVILIDSETGQPQAVLDGRMLTAIRTGAASGLATSLLAPETARSVAVIGSGAQARTQLDAVCAVRSFDEVRVYSPHRDHAQAYVREMSARFEVSEGFEVAESAAAAVQDADVICVATTSRSPVLWEGDVRAGAHINAVGSFTPDMIELDPKLVASCRVVVDQREAAMKEAGEVIAAVREGLILQDELAELGSIAASDATAHRHPGEITLFKSVGLAVQDLAAAHVALRRAEKEGLGTEVAL